MYSTGDASVRRVPRTWHLLVELHGCDVAKLDSVDAIAAALHTAAAAVQVRVIRSAFHHFEPHGVTGALILAESHITIHTWPEAGYAAADVFSCGRRLPHVATEIMQREMGARLVSTHLVHRGPDFHPDGVAIAGR